MSSVLFVSKPVEPPWNDSSKNLVRDLVGALRGHDATVMIRRGGRGPRGVKTSPVYAPGGKGGFAPALVDNARVLARLVAGPKSDIWHFFFAPNPRTAKAARAAIRVRRPKTVHTVCSAPSEEGGVARLRESLFADRVVVLSEHTQRRFAAAGILCTRIPPAITPLAVPDAAERRQTRARLQLPVDGPLLVYPGDLEFGHGARTTIEAFARGTKDAHLVMACRRKTEEARVKEDELRRLAVRRAAGRVHWIGETPHIHALLGASDVVCLPTDTLFAKMDYPLVLLEAMSQARAVVVAEGTPAAELAEDGAAACVPPDVDALSATLRELVDDDAARQQLGAAGRRAVLERFSPAPMARAYEALYAEL